VDPTLRTELAERDGNSAAPSATAQMNTWKTHAGIWRENPDFDAFLQEIAKLRRETDEAHNTETP